MIKYAIATAMMLFTSLSLFAQTEPKALVIEGYGEVYYGYDFNEPNSNERSLGVVSHNRHNEVNINMALLRAVYDKDRVRANIGIMAGTYANANMTAEPGVLKNIYEANAGFRLHKRHELWIDAGIFPSHIGAEGALSMDCPTLTRSMMADASPYYEAGARVSYTTLNQKWYIAFMHMNGWQRIQRQNGNSTPAGGMQLKYMPNSKLVFNLSTFVGSDKPDIDESRRYFVDFYTTAKLTKKLELTAAIDLGNERYIWHGANVFVTNNWLGTAVILKYKATAKAAWVARGEYFYDPNNTIMPQTTLNSLNGFDVAAYSIGYDRKLMDNLLWRIEGKGYVSASNSFYRGNALFNDNYVLTTSLAVRFNNRKNH